MALQSYLLQKISGYILRQTGSSFLWQWLTLVLESPFIRRVTFAISHQRATRGCTWHFSGSSSTLRSQIFVPWFGTERRPRVVILAAWLIPFAISLLLLVGMYATKSHTVLKVLRITGVSAFDIISCALLFYGVIRILVVARAQSRQLSAMELRVQRSSNSCNQSANLHATSDRRKKHNTASFVIALVVFFLGCYVVVNYLVLCMAFSCHQVSGDIAQVVICLLLVNSAVNPLVYALLKDDIKIELRKLICRSNNHRGGSLMRALNSFPFSFFYWHVSTYMPIAFVVFFTYFTPKVLSDLRSR